MLPTVGAADVPVRARGVELLGEVPGSGYRRPPALARRADGQVVQLSPLLYLLLAAADGRRDAGEVADVVSAKCGRRLTEAQVRALANRLRPLGLLRSASGAEPDTKPANPLLGLRWKVVVSEPAKTRRITTPFARLFHPAVVWPLLVVFAAVAWWTLFHEGLAGATRSAFDEPGQLLLVFAITVISTGFHEFGHAAACRYGGATPGAMGAGVYLVWPAFYTDVTDSYRLGRAGRLRVDLGGLYFNAVFAVAVAALYTVTGWESLMLAIAAQAVQMIRQLAPMVRFDGYHVLADLVGVPDLYAHIGPTLRGVVTWGRRRRPSQLKPWAQAVVTLWVLAVVPLLFGLLLVTVMTLPRVAGTAAHSLAGQWHRLAAGFGTGDLATAGAALLAIIATGLGLLGMAYLLGRTLRSWLRSSWKWTAGRPRWRRMLVVGLVSAAVILVVLWWPQPDRYRPFDHDDRGTVLELMPLTRRLPPPTASPTASPTSPVRPVPVVQRASRSVWAGATPPPKRHAPQLALVLKPRGEDDDGGDDDETWVFPFNPPKAPGPGDNQALAVNTGDGSTVYDVAFALVWADDDAQDLNRNEAYALAKCRDCRTVAIAFQVVLIVGRANVIVPQNIATAVNYQCLRCVTLALAHQVVVTLPGPLSPGATARVEALWRRIAAFGARVEGMPPQQIMDRLEAFERELLAIIRADLKPSPTATPSGGTPTPSEATPPPSESPSGSPSGPPPSGPPPSGPPPSGPLPSATGSSPPALPTPSDVPTPTLPELPTPTPPDPSTPSPTPSPDYSHSESASPMEDPPPG